VGSLLIVDDHPRGAAALEMLLVAAGYEVRTAPGGAAALRLVRDEPPDLVLMDVRMPGMDGFDACRSIKEDDQTRLIPVVLVTAFDDSRSRIRGIEVGADDFISKPINPSELLARVGALLRVKRYTDELDSAESVLVALSLTIEVRDGMTEGHCQRLAEHASALGRTIGLDDDDVFALRRGGFLHDIGKVGIPDAVLFKPGPLTFGEYELIKQHTTIGDRICCGLRSLRKVRPIVRHHHERLNGTGYPDGLRGDAIPLLAQIMSVVDVFDALINPRPYRAALPVAHAIDELRREAEFEWLRPDLVEIFAAQIDRGEVASAVPSGGGRPRTFRPEPGAPRFAPVEASPMRLQSAGAAGGATHLTAGLWRLPRL
jgi:putative two-component system response regulator